MSWRVVLAGACSLIALASTAAAQPRYLISVEFRGDPPQKVYLDRSGATPEALTNKDNVFSITVASPNRVTEAQLRAVYNDGGEASLGIRFVPFSPTVPVTVYRSAPAPCVNGIVEPLERPSSQVRANLEAYFKARDLAQGRATTPCGTTMTKRVARAWFNKSYALATNTTHLAFDRDSADFLRKVDPRSAPEIDKSLRQIEGREFALNYRLQLWAVTAGDLTLAQSVNDELVKALAQNPEARMAAGLQRIDARRLNEDAKYLRALSDDQVFYDIGDPALLDGRAFPRLKSELFGVTRSDAKGDAARSEPSVLRKDAKGDSGRSEASAGAATASTVPSGPSK
jgi:hypothetical protein